MTASNRLNQTVMNQNVEQIVDKVSKNLLNVNSKRRSILLSIRLNISYQLRLDRSKSLRLVLKNFHAYLNCFYSKASQRLQNVKFLINSAIFLLILDLLVNFQASAKKMIYFILICIDTRIAALRDLFQKS